MIWTSSLSIILFLCILQSNHSEIMVESGREYVLQWPGHAAYVTERFSGLLARQALVDVTLLCEEQKLRVHKLVLASCSLYFEVCILSFKFITCFKIPNNISWQLILAQYLSNIYKEKMYCFTLTGDPIRKLLRCKQFFLT